MIHVYTHGMRHSSAMTLSDMACTRLRTSTISTSTHNASIGIRRVTPAIPFRTIYGHLGYR
jgi:hypothetical protein